MSVGYARAARILDQLQEAGVVGEADGSKPREVLIQSAAQFFEKPSENSDGQLN
jgi:S-DNA-T family DNA segregation ATPase FtsK/SpoIIIE